MVAQNGSSKWYFKKHKLKVHRKLKMVANKNSSIGSLLSLQIFDQKNQLKMVAQKVSLKK